MRRTIVAAITLLTTAALVSGAAVADASAARPARAPQEHFRVISTTTGSRRQSVLATGAFTAGGYLVPGRLVALRSTDRVVFPNGSFHMVRHITHQWLPMPTASCLVRETLRGSYVLEHGTGAYRRISGSGGFVLRIFGVIRRAHRKCGGPMTVFQQIIYASGRTRR
ncbi:MAG TPA: hypothetical protein VHU92_28760 [Streptosporangiaceae bacterium]|jgi:hypothetical protein|nr:hypothetical protein [Streptosporangiaceae bacterium]